MHTEILFHLNHHFVHESCTDIRKVLTVTTYQTDTFRLNSATPMPFFGCVKNAAAYKISEYSVKVSNNHIYNEPVKEVSHTIFEKLRQW